MLHQIKMLQDQDNTAKKKQYVCSIAKTIENCIVVVVVVEATLRYRISQPDRRKATGGPWLP